MKLHNCPVDRLWIKPIARSRPNQRPFILWPQPLQALPNGFFHRSTVYRVQLTVDQSPSLAEWTCETGDESNGTRLAFRLEARGAGALLRFTHANWRAQTEYFTSCNTTWGTLMYRLKAAAEEKSPGPLFLAADMAY